MIPRVVGIDSEKKSIGSDPFYVVVRHFDCINSFWIWPVAKWKWDLVELMKAYSDTLGRLVTNIPAFDAAWVLFENRCLFLLLIMWTNCEAFFVVTIHSPAANDTIVIAPFQGAYCRATILNVHPDGTCDVLFVDQGNRKVREKWIKSFFRLTGSDG